MKKITTAIWENGVFRPEVPQAFTELKPGQQVWIIVRDIVTDPEKAKILDAKVLARMRAEGTLDESPIPVDGPPPENYVPPVIEGEPLSETIIRMRKGEYP